MRNTIRRDSTGTMRPLSIPRKAPTMIRAISPVSRFLPTIAFGRARPMRYVRRGAIACDGVVNALYLLCCSLPDPEPPVPKPRVVWGVPLVGLVRGGGATEDPPPPPPDWVGRELCAATPPETGLAGRAPPPPPPLSPPPCWPRVLWVLMPWATRLAGELMTAAAWEPSVACLRPVRAEAISSPKPGT